MNPMYIAYSPPMMLPTVTMNPTTAASASPTSKAKRDYVEGMELPLNKDAKHIKRSIERSPTIDVNIIWWMGVGMTVFGGAAYLL